MVQVTRDWYRVKLHVKEHTISAFDGQDACACMIREKWDGWYNLYFMIKGRGWRGEGDIIT